MGAAALGRLAVVPKYGLLMVQLHFDGSVKVGVVRGAAALEDRRWGQKCGSLMVQLQWEIRLWQGMGREGCSCTKKTGGGGKVWVVRGAAALRRLAVVARYEPLGVQLHRENTGVRASYGSVGVQLHWADKRLWQAIDQ